MGSTVKFMAVNLFRFRAVSPTGLSEAHAQVLFSFLTHNTAPSPFYDPKLRSLKPRAQARYRAPRLNFSNFLMCVKRAYA